MSVVMSISILLDRKKAEVISILVVYLYMSKDVMIFYINVEELKCGQLCRERIRTRKIGYQISDFEIHTHKRDNGYGIKSDM